MLVIHIHESMLVFAEVLIILCAIYIKILVILLVHIVESILALTAVPLL